jgi:hypothetical protein
MIMVTAVNDPPVAHDDAAITQRDTPVELPRSTLLSNDTDIDSAPDSWSIASVDEAVNCSVTNHPQTEDLVVVPESGFSGRAYFVYTLADGDGGTDTATVVVDVKPRRWQNPLNPSDVEGNGHVAPLDVLTLINYINAHPNDSSLPPLPAAPPPYYDVNGDDQCTALDVLTVINHINSLPLREAEGEEIEFVESSPLFGRLPPVHAPARVSQPIPSATPTNTTAPMTRPHTVNDMPCPPFRRLNDDADTGVLEAASDMPVLHSHRSVPSEAMAGIDLALNELLSDLSDEATILWR